MNIEEFRLLKNRDFMAGVKGGKYSTAISAMPRPNPGDRIAVPAGPSGEEIELTDEDEAILDRAWENIAKRERRQKKRKK